MTMYGTRTTTALYLREAFPVSISGLGEGKTVTAKICAEETGDPSAIGTLSITLDESSPGEYFAFFPRADLLSEINAASMVGRAVFLHLDDGVEWHDVWPLKAVDRDPDIRAP